MILVKFPTRERPQRAKDVLMGWISKAENLEGIHWLVSLDSNDPTMQEFDTLAGINLPKSSTVIYGSSASKVHAINRDISTLEVAWDILLVISDDMICKAKGWDTTIRAAMNQHQPDGDGLLWFFDGKQRDICTLPCMGRAYYTRFGYVYHPSYTSVFCDDEQTAVARSNSRLHYFQTVIAEHHHPANFSHIKPDALYRKNETTAIWAKDEANYRKRKAAGFP